MEDGGYYAIKGFNFQIDKALFEIYSAATPTELIYIENIQDINTDHVVYQVKHKEAQSFSNSKIREPVVKLIEDYILDPSKKYCLYCYFKDVSAGVQKIEYKDLVNYLVIDIKPDSSDKLKNLHKKISGFSQQTLNGFFSKFELVYAHNYDFQYASLLDIFVSSNLASSLEEAEIYYCLMAEHLRKLVISNDDKQSRSCTREQLELGIIESRKTIFKNIGDYDKNRESILKIYRKEISFAPKDKEFHIFLGLSCVSDENCFKMISSILDNHFNNALYNIAPITFVFEGGVPVGVKEYLISNQYYYNDGFETILFNIEYYSSPHFFTRKKVGKNKVTNSLDRISFKLRLISLDNYRGNLDLITKPRLAICFDSVNSENLLKENKIINHSYFGINSNEIVNLLRR